MANGWFPDENPAVIPVPGTKILIWSLRQYAEKEGITHRGAKDRIHKRVPYTNKQGFIPLGDGFLAFTVDNRWMVMKQFRTL